jgi:hypothetical protein
MILIELLLFITKLASKVIGLIATVMLLLLGPAVIGIISSLVVVLLLTPLPIARLLTAGGATIHAR